MTEEVKQLLARTDKLFRNHEKRMREILGADYTPEQYDLDDEMEDL